MKQQTSQPIEKKKVIIITSLFVTSIIIMLSGAFFIIFSLVNHTSFMVLNTSVHGAFFGATVLYLGFRNFLSVRKLKTEVYKSSSKFSWSNFRKSKSNRLPARSR